MDPARVLIQRIHGIKIKLLVVQQRAAVVQHRRVVREEADLETVVRDVIEEAAGAAAVGVGPHADGEAGQCAFGERQRVAGEHPVSGVGVCGEGVAAVGEGGGVGWDRAEGIDAAEGEDVERVGAGGGWGGGDGAEKRERDEEDLAEHDERVVGGIGGGEE